MSDQTELNDLKDTAVSETEDQPEELTEDQPEELTEDQSEELTEDQPEELTEDQPEELTEDQPEELTEDQPEELTSDPDMELTGDLSQFAEELREEMDERKPAAAPSKKKKRKHRKKHRILRLLIAVAVIAVFVLIANLSYFEITEMAVIGNKTVTDEEILALSEIEAGDSIFLINPLAVKSRIKKNLYISEVRLDRQMPGTVEIIVTEREAAAQFIKMGKDNKKTYIVTDADGMVMGKFDKRQKVTLIDRDSVKAVAATEGSQIQVSDTGAYKKAMNLIREARLGDLFFKKIDVQGSLIEATVFDKLKCHGRYRNVIASIQSGELKSVIYRLYQEDVSKGTINIGDNNYCSFTPEK